MKRMEECPTCGQSRCVDLGDKYYCFRFGVTRKKAKGTSTMDSEERTRRIAKKQAKKRASGQGDDHQLLLFDLDSDKSVKHEEYGLK